MGNRISFDEISKQLRSIYGVMLCYIQDEIQNDAPYLIRYGQFESVIGNLCKKTTNSFIRLKSLHCTQDVILHHCQSETCDLGGKMYGLALAQVQQGLTVLVCDFGSPTSGVYTICLKKAEEKIGCQQAVPITFATSFAEEQTNRYAIQLNVHRAICAAKSSVVLTCLRLLLVPDDLLGIHLTRFCGVVGLAQLYHAQQMTLDMPAGYESHELGVGKPAIYKQVIETDTSLDGILDHVNGLVCLLHQVFVDTLLYRLILVVFGKASLPLFGSKSLHLLLVLAFLTVKREIEKKLANPIGKHHRETLVAKDALLVNMRPDSANEFSLHASLGGIGIINNQTNGLVLRSCCAA